MARILIVDDEPAVRNVIEKIMLRDGHEVLSAGFGLVALKTLADHPVDLVITDIVMPYMTGVKLIDEIRTHYPDIKILAISGGGDRYSPETCVALAKEHGADRAMMKPFIQSELTALTKELLAAAHP